MSDLSALGILLLKCLNHDWRNTESDSHDDLRYVEDNHEKLFTKSIERSEAQHHLLDLIKEMLGSRRSAELERLQLVSLVIRVCQ